MSGSSSSPWMPEKIAEDTTRPPAPSLLSSLGSSLSSTISSSLDADDLPITTKWGTVPSQQVSSHIVNSGHVLAAWLRNRRQLVTVFASLSVVLLWYSKGWQIPATFVVPDHAIFDRQAVHVPPECLNSTFKENGWIFDPAIDPESRDVASRQYLLKLPSQRSIQQICVDEWIANSEVCQQIQEGIQPLSEERIEAAWTFIQPTPHWDQYLKHYSRRVSTGTSQSRFRSLNQLRYSLRSVRMNAPFIGKMYLIGTGLPITGPTETSTESQCRVVQAPAWLDTGSKSFSDGQVQIISDYNLFGPSSAVPDEDTWLREALPTFNSRSIESQMSHLPISSTYFLYLNDDFYISGSLNPSDIATSLTGPTVRMEDRWLSGILHPSKKQDMQSRRTTVGYTWALLDARFGVRERSWLAHIAYTMSLPMLREVEATWSNEIHQTAKVRFRGRGQQLEMTFMPTLYMLEKHREALLWSYFVAAADADGSGTYSEEERARMWNLLSSSGEIGPGRVLVRKPLRIGTYTENYYEDKIQSAGLKRPLGTSLQWSSQDGYPYSGETRSFSSTFDGDEPEFCTILLTKCFGRHDFFELGSGSPGQRGTTPAQLFKHVAYRRPECGDCIMNALLIASGPQGLSAFLPKPREADDKDESRPWEDHVPFIGGFSKSWEKVDFSLSTALGGLWKPRDFAVRLIHRYSYTLGESPFVFHCLTNSEADFEVLDRLEQNPPAFMALNDDMPDVPATQTKNFQKLESRLLALHEKLFGEEMECEIQDVQRSLK